MLLLLLFYASLYVVGDVDERHDDDVMVFLLSFDDRERARERTNFCVDDDGIPPFMMVPIFSYPFSKKGV